MSASIPGEPAETEPKPPTVLGPAPGSNEFHITYIGMEPGEVLPWHTHTPITAHIYVPLSGDLKVSDVDTDGDGTNAGEACDPKNDPTYGLVFETLRGRVLERQEDAVDPSELFETVGVGEVRGLGDRLGPVESDPPVGEDRRVGPCVREGRSNVEHVDTVEVSRDAMEVLQRGLEEAPHAVVVFEVGVLVRASGHLDHPMGEGALCRAATEVEPGVLEAVVGLVVRPRIVEANAVTNCPPQRRVFPRSRRVVPAGGRPRRGRIDRLVTGVLGHARG
jgi:hypothetical protein